MFTSINSKKRLYVVETKRRRRPNTKTEKARKIFCAYYNRGGRQAVLEALRNEMGLSDRAAITYYQNLRIEFGIPPTQQIRKDPEVSFLLPRAQVSLQEVRDLHLIDLPDGSLD